MYKQNLSLTLDPSLSFYIGCTVCFFSFLNTLQPEWMLGRHLCWGRRGSHMTQSRSSGPKQERGNMSRHGTSRDCLQPHHDDKSICTVQHRSDRMQDPSGGGPGISCVCVCGGVESPPIWEVLLWGGISHHVKTEPGQSEGRPGWGRQSPSGAGLLAAGWVTVTKRELPRQADPRRGVLLSVWAHGYKKAKETERTRTEVGLAFGLLVRIHNFNINR